MKISSTFSRLKYFIFVILTSRNKRWVFYYKRIKPLFTTRQNVSQFPIDVVILAIEKDLETLPFVIEGVRRNIKHPISDIFVISPLSAKIQNLCISQDCVFINERTLLDIDPDQMNITINGRERAKWYYQQFLKWSCDKFLNETHYLVVDADTIFVRPQVFEHKGKLILNVSHEYHRPYFDIYRRLLGETARSPTSFISHNMLFSKQVVTELKEVLEEHNGCLWYEAILNNLDHRQFSGFSEYETYGNYMFSHHRSAILLDYWFNKSLNRTFLQDNLSLEQLYGKDYKSISFHSWNK